MKSKKLLSMTLVAAMTMSMLSGCGSSTTTTADDDETTGTTNAATETVDLANVEVDQSDAEGYTYGEGQTFHSDDPVTYSMMFSDHENYPYKADWRLWSAIQEKTNVTFDLNIIARTDYEDKKSTLINTGDSPYIIPKTYDESAYVEGGQIVPISDWVQYMPNYMKCVKDWGLDEDLKQKVKSDGKYYVLPGMWEEAGAGYSLVIRKDVFDAAGVDVTALEKDWTWEDFYDACKKVKEYTGADYVWSDVYNGACALSISSKQYNVKAGRASDGGDWNLGTGTKFDHDTQQYYFADSSDDYKEFLKYWNKMYADGIMDPETYSEDSDTAREKFYSGKSYVLTLNYQQLADMQANNKVQVDGAELYMVVCPGGPKQSIQTETSRLENGIMIAQKALDELGEEDFIKMLRFIDWLWYSNEGQTLCLWGVEGETYSVNNGEIVLNSDIYYNGINEGATKQLNVDYGFGGGVFAYGGTNALKESKMTEGEKDFNNRTHTNREQAKLDPPIMANEEQTEEMDLIKTPLMDYVNEMALTFITGKEDIDSGWDAYVTECDNKGAGQYIDMANEIFQSTKSLLGY